MAERKRILMISTSYPENAEDWRGRFIANMAQSTADRQDLALSLWAPPGEHPNNVTDATTPADKKWLQGLLSQGGIAHQLRSNKITGLKLAAGLLTRLYRAYRREPPDLTHVNWLQNALPLWGTNIPALITVLGSDYGLLSKPGMIPMLRAVFRQRPTILAPNATWMTPKLEESFSDVAKISTVPFGVDQRWFTIDRADAEPGCWLAITRITRNKIGDLFSWGESLFENRKLHLFGPMQEQIDLPAWVTWHGPTHPSELRETWFPRATGLITLSCHDEGRPQVMLEAMAAGLPVIASDLPAHRDFVRHRETGWLINSRKELAPALDTLDDMKNNHATGEAARRWVKQSIGNWDDCAARYAILYQELYTS
ncbi:MAG: glycosyltransferase family 4 protein [Candidatus Sedimenticola sp. (ex Thyasira tokunagai)]